MNPFTKSLYMLIAVACMSANPLWAQHEEEEREQETAIKKFEEFHEAWKENSLTSDGLLNSIQQTTTTEKSHYKKAQTTWQFLGPMNQSGRMTGVVVTKKNISLWYAVADGGGVWQSNNAGTNWQPIGDTFPSLRMSSIGISEITDSIIVAGTHEGFLYLTKNAGKSWRVITPCSSCSYVYDIKFHPAESGRFLVSMDGGLYESKDTGKTFKQLLSGARFYSSFYRTDKTDEIFSAANYANNRYGLLLSLKKKTATTYTSIQLLKVRTSYYGVIKIDECKTKPAILYASLADSGVIIKSLDTGKTWTKTPTTPYRDNYHKGYDYIAVAPDNPNYVFTGNTWMFRTSDGGKTWEAADTVNGRSPNPDVHVDVHCLYFPAHLKDNFLACNDGGIYRTGKYKDGIIIWTYKGRNLPTLQIYNCSLHPQTDDTIIVGCQDNGYDKYSGNKSNWKVVGGDGFCTIYDYDNPEYFYHEYCYGNLHRAGNGFTWWSDKKMKGLSAGPNFYDGIVSPERVDWFGQAITISPRDAKTLYFGTNYLYKTTDRADNWSKMSNTELSANNSDCITKITVAPSDSSWLYAGTYYGNFYKIKDSGSNPVITNITGSLAKSRWRGIAVSPSDYKKLFICGDGGWSNKGIYKSTNGGKTWAQLYKGLPKAAINCIYMHPRDENFLFAGTTYGLYFSSNSGNDWSKVGGLPNAEVWDMDLKMRGSKLSVLVGTYGRGAIYTDNFDTTTIVITSVAETENTDKLFSVYPTIITENTPINILANTGSFITSTSVYDETGKLIYSSATNKNFSGKATFSLPYSLLHPLPQGVYILRIEHTGGIFTQKIIKP